MDLALPVIKDRLKSKRPGVSVGTSGGGPVPPLWTGCCSHRPDWQSVANPHQRIDLSSGKSTR